MTRKPSPDPERELRRGWTTGACATAATKAALMALWQGVFPKDVGIVLPKGETPVFPLAHQAVGEGWAEVGITKDAGDDPDVTHGALIIVRVAHGQAGQGVQFKAGVGVGMVTKAGLPIAPGEPAINPVPREMMQAEVAKLAEHTGETQDIELTISVPGGAELALKTWNPRLGIKGGLSILGTTGVVRPFSCAAWIASIHRGVDVARADGLTHVAGCTGATSERVVQAEFELPDHAMLDMGDFAGGLMKYMRKHPVARLTIGGGIGKITKLAQGATDLHSSRSQVDFAQLGAWAQKLGLPAAAIAGANTAAEVGEIGGAVLSKYIAAKARENAQLFIGENTVIDVLMVDRAGTILATAT